jgi:hemoglobin-like flavoprotein
MPAPDEIRVVRDSFGRLEGGVGPVVDLFYMRLFAIAPAARDLFADDVAVQNGKFASMLAEFVDRLDDPQGFALAVERLGRRHRGYGVVPAHYALVEEALVWALARELGDAFTADVEAAWKGFYRAIAAGMQAAGGGGSGRGARTGR